MNDFIKTSETVTVPDLMARFGEGYLKARRAVRDAEQKNIVRYRDGIVYENVAAVSAKEEQGPKVGDAVAIDFSPPFAPDDDYTDKDSIARRLSELAEKRKELGEKRYKLEEWVQKNNRSENLRKACAEISILPDSSAFMVSPLIAKTNYVSPSTLMIVRHKLSDGREIMLELTGERAPFKLRVKEGIENLEKIATTSDPYCRRDIETVMLKYGVILRPDELSVEVPHDTDVVSCFMALTVAISEILKITES